MKKTWQEKLKDKTKLSEVHKLKRRFLCYDAVSAGFTVRTPGVDFGEA